MMASRRLLSLPRRPMSASSSQNSFESDTTEFERELYALVGKSRNSVNEISKFGEQYLKFVENSSAGSGKWEVYPAENPEVGDGKDKDGDDKADVILEEELKSLADSFQSQNLSFAFPSRHSRPIEGMPDAAEIHEIFTWLDEDETGSLSKGELKKALSCFNIDLTKDKFNELLGQVDENADGEVNEEEFTRMLPILKNLAAEAPAEMSEDDCVQLIMDKYNTDGEEGISMAEFGEYLKSSGDDCLTDEEVQDLFQTVNKNDDDKLTADELKMMIQMLSSHEM